MRREFSGPAKSVDTSVGAADTSVRATLGGRYRHYGNDMII
jgi:hypothetical protein